MGCCGGDRERGAVTEQQKWDYITLSDFRSRSCLSFFSYIWLYMLALITVAVFVADLFTAVTLLAFNRWTNSNVDVQPKIPWQVAKWIFAGTIIFSWTLAILEGIRAIRVIRRGGVADSYLDPVAAVLQSMRMGRGKPGWRRFLVFAELTKSRKGADYIALFSYFQFKGAIRILVAEGPRVVINALTLYSVMTAKLIKVANDDGRSSFDQFWHNVEQIAQDNRQQAIIMFTMLFTTIIWVFEALLLLASVVLYICFLWHYIPSSDGSLSRYCRRKVDTRLERIVSAKVRKALEEEDAKLRKAALKAAKGGKGGKRPPGQALRQPTLPSLSEYNDEKMGSEVSLIKNDSQSTMATLPQYSSRQGSVRSGLSRQPTLPEVGGVNANDRPHFPSRSGTQSSAFSNTSYGSNAPLLSQPGGMGYDDPLSPGGPVPPLPSFNGDSRGASPLNRSMTGSTQYSVQTPRSFTPMSRPPTAGPLRTNTGSSSQGRGTPFSPNNQYSNHTTSPISPLSRQESLMSAASRRTPGPGAGPSPISPVSAYDQRTYSPAYKQSYEMNPVDKHPTEQALEDYFSPPMAQAQLHTGTPASAGSGSGGYVAFNPSLHSRDGTPAPRRDMSTPLPMQSRSNTAIGYQVAQRSATAPIPPLDPRGQPRSATAGPQHGPPMQRSWNGGYAP